MLANFIKRALSVLLDMLLICFYAEHGDVEKLENLEHVEADEMKVAYEKWKSKTYALTVPLRIVALRNSLPPVWFRVCFHLLLLLFFKPFSCIN